MSALGDLPREFVWAWLALAAGLGACFGSFANVLVHRLPRDLSIVRPRSRCPGCGHPVRPRDNLPVLSWLLLRGRCRDCGAHIAVRYPLVEAAGAAAGVIALLRFGPGAPALAALLFLVALLAIALIDWEFMIIPHTLTVGGMVAGLALAPWTPIGLRGALLGGALGAGIVLGLARGYRLIRGADGMGGGDVMLMGMVGIFAGAWGALAVLFGGALLGTLYALARYRTTLAGKTRLPFGTFLAAAAAGLCLAGDGPLRWYLALLR